MRSRNVLSVDASVSVELGCVPFLVCGCIYQFGISSGSIIYGFLWRPHYIGMTDFKSLAIGDQSLVPLPLPEVTW